MPSVDSSGQLESGYLQGEREAKLGSRMVTGGSHIMNQDQIESGTMVYKLHEVCGTTTDRLQHDSGSWTSDTTQTGPNYQHFLSAYFV